MTTRKPPAPAELAALLDTVDLEALDVPSGTVVVDAVVIAKTLEPDGTVGVHISCSAGTDWLTRWALVNWAGETVGGENEDA